MCPSSGGDNAGELSNKLEDDLSIRNRILSIHYDSDYVKSVVTQIPTAAVVANERCGSWYVPPAIRTGAAYFKSTDGHKGVWSFNTRRLNLGLLSILGTHEQVFLVDSARRKPMSDALSKTVPIWVAIMNRLLFTERIDCHNLCTDTKYVPLVEHVQIEARLDHFLEKAKGLCLDVHSLRHVVRLPIKVHFHPLRESTEHLSSFASLDHVHLICLSASPDQDSTGATTHEFHYIPGAGDDAEHWARGLTAELLWQNMSTMLLCSGHDEVTKAADVIVTCYKAESLGARPWNYATLPPVYVTPSAQPFYIGGSRALEAAQNGDIQIDAAIVCREVNDWASNTSDGIDELATAMSLVRLREGKEGDFPVLSLHCPASKLGSRALRKEYRLVEPFLEKCFDSISAPRLLFACDSGVDLAIGVALATTCLHLDTDGRFRPQAKQLQATANDEGKPFIRRRLVQILEQTGLDDIGGSEGKGIQRSTLNSVNSLVIAKPRRTAHHTQDLGEGRIAGQSTA